MDGGKHQVSLLLYDLTNGNNIFYKGMAKAMSPMLLGKTLEAVYHSSIVVYGTEFFYGGGICEGFPRVIKA
jgi:hypothetical protein